MPLSFFVMGSVTGFVWLKSPVTSTFFASGAKRLNVTLPSGFSTGDTADALSHRACCAMDATLSAIPARKIVKRFMSVLF